MPPCGGAPKRKASSRKPKRSRRLGGVDAEDAEHPLLQLGVVDTDRSAGELDAVEHDVVGERPRLARIAVEQRQVFGMRMRERMVHRAEAPLVRAPLDQREVDHPEQLVPFLPVTILLGQRHAQIAERRRGPRARRRHQEREVAVAQLQARAGALELARGERVLDLELQRAVAVAQRENAGRAVHARALRPLVDLLAAGAGGAGNRETEDRAALLRGLAEGAEAALAQLAR